MTDPRIEMLSPDTLVAYAGNARTHAQWQVQQIAASIKEFGFTNPVLIAEDDTVIAGHGRVLAAMELRLPLVPCIRLAHLTPEQRRAYVIADNQLALNAGWDEQVLSAELEALRDAEFDLSLLGFGDAELRDLLAADEEKAPPEEFKEVDETIETAHECPKCHFKWS